MPTRKKQSMAAAAASAEAADNRLTAERVELIEAEFSKGTAIKDISALLKGMGKPITEPKLRERRTAFIARELREQLVAGTPGDNQAIEARLVGFGVDVKQLERGAGVGQYIDKLRAMAAEEPKKRRMGVSPKKLAAARLAVEGGQVPSKAAKTSGLHHNALNLRGVKQPELTGDDCWFDYNLRRFCVPPRKDEADEKRAKCEARGWRYDPWEAARREGFSLSERISIAKTTTWWCQDLYERAKAEGFAGKDCVRIAQGLVNEEFYIYFQSTVGYIDIMDDRHIALRKGDLSDEEFTERFTAVVERLAKGKSEYLRQLATRASDRSSGLSWFIEGDDLLRSSLPLDDWTLVILEFAASFGEYSDADFEGDDQFVQVGKPSRMNCYSRVAM